GRRRRHLRVAARRRGLELPLAGPRGASRLPALSGPRQPDLARRDDPANGRPRPGLRPGEATRRLRAADPGRGHRFARWPALLGRGKGTAPPGRGAPARASPGKSALRVIGRGLSPDRKEALDASARRGPEMIHEAVPGQIIGPVAPAIQPPPPAPARVTRE